MDRLDEGKVFISYSQNFEDVMLYRALKDIEKGFYIDVGAWDPILDSVTKAFYDRGWHGINIEPSRTFYEKLVLMRPRDINLMAVISNRIGVVDFYEILETGLSTTNKHAAEHFAQKGYKVRKYQVPCLPLSEICKAYHIKEIHFLKIDVEGMEKEVVEGFDFETFRPWIILIEAIDPVQQTPVEPVWESILLAHDYEFVYWDGLNMFYLAREKATLKRAFISPPGIFDAFIRYSEWKTMQENRVLQVRLAEAQAQAEAERATLHKQVEELREAQARLQEEREQLRLRLAEAQAQAEAERAALHKQVEELQRWLKAVYTSTSWRITAPLRLAKRIAVKVIRKIKKALAKLKHLAFRLSLEGIRKLARWAALNPRLRRLGKKVLNRAPALKAWVRRLLATETSPGSSTEAPQQPKQKPLEWAHMSETARRVYWELREELERTEFEAAP